MADIIARWWMDELGESAEFLVILLAALLIAIPITVGIGIAALRKKSRR